MELSITIQEPQKRMQLFGTGDRNLRRIAAETGVRLNARNDTIRIIGPADRVAKAAAIIERLQNQLRNSSDLAVEDIDVALSDVMMVDAPKASGELDVYTSRNDLVPRTEGQEEYLQAMLKHECVICLGPAGTGKTYLAVAVAVHMLKKGQIKRICLVRPAVEAGERLGFLPGDFRAKVNPYLQPLFDAMHDMMSYEQLKRFMVNEIVEVVPLAYMRGRTLNNAAIILDEAQNATPSQMLMFLTRLGQNSRMIVTGDDSQVDLDYRQQSGLTDAAYKLADVPGIAIVRLQKSDIVRHELVQKIVDRYAQSAGEE
ncbi:MAG: PhoH family protein [Phycisphaerae bacterium]